MSEAKRLNGQAKRSREDWLHTVAVRLKTGAFRKAKIKLPDVQISVGWPLGRRAVLRKGDSGVIGQCFNAKLAGDAKPHIFISPVLDDSIQIIGVLAHELIHAAMPDAEHGPEFAKAAYAIGLTGKPTATKGGEDFNEWAAALIREIGEFPHGGLAGGASAHTPRSQGTRMVKCECSKCGYIVRTTQKWLDVGLPLCPDGDAMLTDEGDGEDEE